MGANVIKPAAMAVKPLASARVGAPRAALGDISANSVSVASVDVVKKPSMPAVSAPVATDDSEMADAPVIESQPPSAQSGVAMDVAAVGSAVMAPVASVPLANPNTLADINRWYLEIEALRSASPKYMSKQTDINAKMRTILVNWLVEVHRKFRLKPETLFLTVNVLDRFLEKKAVSRSKLQLVGVGMYPCYPTFPVPSSVCVLLVLDSFLVSCVCMSLCRCLVDRVQVRRNLCPRSSRIGRDDRQCVHAR
jgi:hypothetical protein